MACLAGKFFTNQINMKTLAVALKIIDLRILA